MNSAAHDIAAHLTALDVVVAGSVFIGEEPLSPNDCVTIYDTGGGDPFPDIEFYDTSIQIRVRDTKYTDAYAKQNQIREALIIPTTFEINGTRYIGVWNQGDIISLGKDQNNRAILTSNYRIERQSL